MKREVFDEAAAGNGTRTDEGQLDDGVGAAAAAVEVGRMEESEETNEGQTDNGQTDAGAGRLEAALREQLLDKFSLWELLLSKVMAGSRDSTKRLYSVFTEVNSLLEFFQGFVKRSCTLSTDGVHQSHDGGYIVPEKSVCTLLTIPMASSRVYLKVFEAFDLEIKSLNDREGGEDLKNGMKKEEDDGFDGEILVDPSKVKVEYGSDGEDYFDYAAEDYEDFGDDFDADKDDGDDKAFRPPQQQLKRKRAGRAEGRQPPKYPEKSRKYYPKYPVSEAEFKKMQRGEMERKCPKCTYDFLTMGGMIKHWNRGTCDLNIRAPDGLIMEVKDPASGEPRLACAFPGCYAETGQNWQNKYSVHIHYGNAHKESVELKAECDICHEKFLTTCVLKIHVKSAHRNGRVDPPVEKKKLYKPTFPLDEETFNAMMADRLEKKCPKCYTLFETKQGMVRHFKRQICSGKTRAPNELVIEIKDEVTGKVRYTCAYVNCPDTGKLWHNRYAVHSHWQRHHKDGVAMTAECNYCGEKFISTTLLKIHIKSSHKKETGHGYTCSLCGKVLTTTAALKMHEMRHTGTKPIQCDYCDYRTYNTGSKNKHMEYMHPDKVGYKFKSHICEQCGKNFKTKQRLKEHMVTHSDRPDPQFQCPICSKFLKQSNSFRKHMVNVHKVQHNCDLCTKAFATTQGLSLHRRQEHGMTADVI